MSTFVRPHAFELSLVPNGENTLRCVVLHINPAGPTVKLELRNEWNDLIQATVTQEKYRQLQIKLGMSIYALPVEMRTFSC